MTTFCVFSSCFTVVCLALPQVIIWSTSVFSSQQDKLLLLSLTSLDAFGRATESAGDILLDFGSHAEPLQPQIPDTGSNCTKKFDSPEVDRDTNNLA